MSSQSTSSAPTVTSPPRAPLDPTVALCQHEHPQAFMEMKQRFPYQSDDVELVRFLKARGYHVPRAAAMYDAHLKWKSATLPVQLTPKLQETLQAKRFYVLESLNSSGRPVMYYNLLKYKSWGLDMQAEVDALIYTMETVLKPRLTTTTTTTTTNDGQQKYVALVDVSGIRSPPVDFLRHINSVMEANYPEYLQKAILFPVPGLVQALIRGMLTFVATETRDKFAYVQDVRNLEREAGMPLDQMGPDVRSLAIQGQLPLLSD